MERFSPRGRENSGLAQRGAGEAGPLLLTWDQEGKSGEKVEKNTGTSVCFWDAS